MSQSSEQSFGELNKKWLITGITGQDGSILANYLLELGYKYIYGVIRRCSTFNTKNIDSIFDKLTLFHGDLTDSYSIRKIIFDCKPDYIVNFAAQSHVKVSHCLEQYTFNTNTLGILYILQTVKDLGLSTKIYQASTSEMYGNMTDGKLLLNENTVMKPVSIYGISKLAAQQICDMYRDAYGMFIVSSILFNHESSKRGYTFVTQKIIKYIANYVNKKTTKPLELGNLNAKRDWGSAYDYVKSIYLMLQQEKPTNYVIATGKTHSVKEFIEIAFNLVGITIVWSGEKEDEIGTCKETNKILIKVNPKYYRDIDIDCLIGDSCKAQKELNWSNSTSFNELIQEMLAEALKN